MTQRGLINERRVEAEATYTERHSLTCGDNKNVSRCDDENGEQRANQLSLLPGCELERLQVDACACFNGKML